MEMRSKLKGMTLVEVLVGAALFGIVSVGGIYLMTEKKKAEITGNAEVLAAEMAENFFKARRDVFATSFEDGPHRINFGNELPAENSLTDGSCPQLQFQRSRGTTDPPDFALAREWIEIPSNGCFGEYTERLSTVQVPDGNELRVGEFRITGAVTPCQERFVTACTGLPYNAGCPATDPACQIRRMRVRVQRTLVDGSSTTTDFPSNNQQGVIGAFLCIVPNGDTDSSINRSALTAYTGLNLKLHFFVRTGSGQLKVFQKETSFARPRLRLADSIIPSAIGCDKSQN